MGWRIWDHKAKRWWGQIYPRHPEALIAELNGEKRPEILVTLNKVART